MTGKIKSMKSQNTTIIMFGMMALSGCNQVTEFDLGSTGSIFTGTNAPAYEHTIFERVSAGNAFVELPADAGAVIDVAQARYGNGVEQLITYQGDYATKGENATSVKMAVHVDGKKQAESLKINSISAGQISSEIEDALPGVNMRISNELHTNAYGPYGYAVGRAPGNVRCIYGWQQMKGSKNDRWAVFKRISEKPKLSIRLRVCRSNVSNDQLVGLMQNLRVNADPAAVLSPTAVSWGAGPAGRSTGALPSYERSGFVSQQRDVYEELDDQPMRITMVRQIKPRRVESRKNPVLEQPREVSHAHVSPAGSETIAADHRPPVPVKPGIEISPTFGHALVPVPPGGSSVQPAYDPVHKAPVVTANSPLPKPVAEATVAAAPVSTTTATVSDRYSAVPLPN